MSSLNQVNFLYWHRIMPGIRLAPGIFFKTEKFVPIRLDGFAVILISTGYKSWPCSIIKSISFPSLSR